MVNFKLNGTETDLTMEEQMLLQRARELPVVYDEDSPELSEDMERAFRTAREAKPYGEAITVYVSPDTAAKARSMGDDYGAVLGRLIEKVMKHYPSTTS